MNEQSINIAIAIVTVCISSAALFLAAYQAYLTRDHFKKTIKPFINTSISRRIKDGIIEMIIENSGFGPAFIKEYKFLFNGLEIKSRSDIDQAFMNLIDSDFKDKGRVIIKKETLLVNIAEQHSLSINSSMVLFQIKIVNSNISNDEIIEAIYNSLHFSIDYEDVLGNKFNCKDYKR